jgi:hypothetical protein
MLTKLATITDSTYENVFKTTLKSFEGLLYESHNPNGNSKWIMPVGVYHRMRKSFGLQFCPSCFIKDGNIPYFRKFWRLSLFTACPSCKIYLYDRCPFCSNVIAFHRHEQGAKNYNISIPICYCAFCKRDLRSAAQIKCRMEIVEIHKEFKKWINKGYTDKHLYSHMFFDVLYQVIKLLVSKSQKLHNLQQYVHRKVGVEWTEKTIRANFDVQNVMVRNQLIQLSHWLLQEWPERFINTCISTDTTSSIALRDFEDAPFWYHTVVISNIYYPNPIKSQGRK